MSLRQACDHLGNVVDIVLICLALQSVGDTVLVRFEDELAFNVRLCHFCPEIDFYLINLGSSMSLGIKQASKGFTELCQFLRHLEHGLVSSLLTAVYSGTHGSRLLELRHHTKALVTLASVGFVFEAWSSRAGVGIQLGPSEWFSECALL